MSDKLTQYNDEVAYNEDVNDIQDLATRSYNKALEGIQYYDCDNSHGAGSYFIPLRILSGFDVTFAAAGTLNFAIGNGEALVAHDETTELDGNVWDDGHYVDQYKRNNVQQARHSTFATGAFPYAITENLDATRDRIDLIEIKFDRVVVTEDRLRLVTIDNRRVQQLVNVEKYTEYVMSDVRIRSGSLAAPPPASYGPRMPALDPDASVPAQLEWLPIASVYVPATTTGFASQPVTIDLRLFYQPKMANGLLNGPLQPLNITTYGVGSSGGPWDQWIAVMKNALVDGGECFPLSGTSKNSQSENPTLGWHPVALNAANIWYFMMEATFLYAPVIDHMFYMYSFRASPRIGTTGICITDICPTGYGTATYGKAGNPSLAISPPIPWPDRYGYTNPASPTSGTLGDYIQEHAHYLASFKCYEDVITHDWQPRPFKKYGNYVSLTGLGWDLDSSVGLTGTDTNEIFAGSIDGGVDIFAITAYTNPAYSGINIPGTTPVVPSHASAIRVSVETSWVSGTGSLGVYLYSEEGENTPPHDGYVFLSPVDLHVTDDEVGHGQRNTVFDIPLQPGFDTLFWLHTSGSPSIAVNVSIDVLGYYEQF